MKIATEIFLVFAGGGLGSIVRFLLSRWVNAWHSHPFPFGTIVVNIFACFALGFIVGIADHRQMMSPAARFFWTVGFCGGFSTFSTFSAEILALHQGGFTATMALYAVLSLALGLTAVYGGLFLGEHG